jgi:hypothetical protein
VAGTENGTDPTSFTSVRTEADRVVTAHMGLQA